MSNERESTVYVSPGKKMDGGKPRYELIPPEALEALAQLYTDGAAKYGDRNWERGMSAARLFGALCRHAWKWFRGEDYDVDPQTGAVTHHLIQVAWNAFAIYTLGQRGMSQYDDRPKATGLQAEAQTAQTQPDSKGPSSPVVSSPGKVLTEKECIDSLTRGIAAGV